MPLAPMLDALGVDTIILGGCTTGGCIRATAVGAEPHDADPFDTDAKYGDVVTLEDVYSDRKACPRDAGGPRSLSIMEVRVEAYVCVACGTQYPPSEAPPEVCLGCIEERQFLPEAGQSWTTLKQLGPTRYNVYRQHEVDVIGIGTEPRFGIGQRAILIRTPEGNILWDLTPFFDEATVQIIKALGGIRAMAISHPHFYTTMVDWSKAFGDVPIYLHAADRDHVRRPDDAIRFWEGDSLELWSGLTLIKGGGHFDGGTMLHWSQGDGGKGIVCCADITFITPDRKFVTFMRSYPTFIPLSAAGARAVAGTLAPYEFDRMYGHFFDMVIEADAKNVVRASLDRYVRAVEGQYDAECGNSLSRP